MHARDISLQSMQSLKKEEESQPILWKSRWHMPDAWPDDKVCLAVPNDFSMTSPNVHLSESIQSGVLPEKATMK